MTAELFVETSRHPQASREITLGDWLVAYAFQRSSRRSIGMVISGEGLSVRAPRWVTIAEIEHALRSRASWICQKLLEQRQRHQQKEANRMRWDDGAVLSYLGESLTLQWDHGGRGVRHDPDLTGVLRIGVSTSSAVAQTVPAQVALWMKRQARQHFESRVAHFSVVMGVSVARLSLTSARTRWGSASAKGGIRLHWRLLHFSPAVIDYVVVHELAHLREMNHSPRFWAIVESILPDYRVHRQTLKRSTMPDWG